MDDEQLIGVFSALSQPSRLAIFRLLVRYEPDGLRAGDIARMLAQPQNTISTHLGILKRAGLLVSARQGTVVIYRAALTQIEDLLQFLRSECCARDAAVTAGNSTAIRSVCMTARSETDERATPIAHKEIPS